MSVFDRWCSAQQRAGPSKPPTTTARGLVHRTHIHLIGEVGPRHVTAVMATAIAYLKRVLRVGRLRLAIHLARPARCAHSVSRMIKE